MREIPTPPPPPLFTQKRKKNKEEINCKPSPRVAELILWDHIPGTQQLLLHPPIPSQSTASADKQASENKGSDKCTRIASAAACE